MQHIPDKGGYPLQRRPHLGTRKPAEPRARGRLAAKGAIRQEKRNVFYYSPLISEEEYNAWATDNLIRKLYNGSARDLVAALVQSEGLSRDDIEELRNMFRVEE